MAAIEVLRIGTRLTLQRTQKLSRFTVVVLPEHVTITGDPGIRGCSSGPSLREHLLRKAEVEANDTRGSEVARKCMLERMAN